jgi:ribose transport system substrate-binding protein
MFKKQALVVFSLVVVFAMLMSSCGTTKTPTAAPTTAAPAATTAPAAKAWKIGFLAGTVDPFYTTMQRGAAQAAADLGVELITQVPQTWNVTAQTPMLDAMVARGDLNFLFLAPVDSQAMIAPLQKASDAGLPILTVDTFVGDGDYASGPVKFPLSFIASDNYLGGQIACRALADALNKTGKIYIQNVKPGISSTDAREKGCKDVLAAEYPKVTMVGVDYNNDDATQAQAQVQAMLQKNPDLGGIFGTNVFSAQGAGTVVKNQGLSGKVKVVAFDATKDAINMLKDGTVDMVIAQKPSDMGYLAVEMAVAYLNGVTSIPKHIPTGYAVITKANMTDPKVSQFFYQDFSGTLPRQTAGVKLGFLAGTVDPFYTTMQRGAQAASDAFGANLVVQVPQTWNVTAQTPMLDAMVARGDLKFLFLAPVDSQAMIAPLQKASDAGLPILTVDTFVGDGDYASGPVKFPLSFIASDNYLGGQIACRALADALNKTGKIYIQNVKPGISSTDAREKGCKDVLAAEYPKVNPDLGGIFGTNVFSAQGAGTVVKNQGLSGKVKVVAFDATKDAINMLSDGTVDMVIAQKPGDMGFFAVEMAMAYMDGVTSIPKHIPTGYAVITKANMADPNIVKFFYK